MESEQQKKGCLEVVCGSMFSGKSEELIRRLKRAKIAKKKVIVFKHSFDDRTTLAHVASHDGNRFDAIAVESALQITEKTPIDADIVGIDEAQFFSHELINVVLDLVDDGKTVIIAGLNLDHRAVPFGPMPTLMSMADKVTKLSAICITCGQDAYFTQRIVNGIPAKYDDPVIQVGAEECYQARCRNCFVMDKKPIWQKTL
jgi:thymidine kinase